MDFNESVIPHYQLQRVPMETLKKSLKIAPDHLKEKSSWFVVDGTLSYFKERNDCRLFSEVFEAEYGAILGFDVASYYLAYISEIPWGKTRAEEAKIGLLSPNYQKEGYNYYLVHDLQQSKISNLGAYGDYTLENLLMFLKQEYADVPGIEQTIQDTINLYLFDYFNGQTDRNPKNICYEMQTEDVSKKDPGYWGLHGKKVTGIKLATVFDSEKSLGIIKGNTGYEVADKSPVWGTALPYSANLDADGFGVDPNIVYLFFDYEKEARPFMERLAYGDEYRKVMERFTSLNSRLLLDEPTKEYLITNFLRKRGELKRLLTM